MIKRILFLLSLFVSSLIIRAQDSTQTQQHLFSKKGEFVLPQAKDWGIGVDATPVFNYINNLGKDFTNKVPTITGKYFKDAHTAYRLSARVGLTNTTTRAQVRDRSIAPGGSGQIFPVSEPTKENTWKRSGTAFGISAGIEKRRGNTRLQGFYGAEAGIYIASSKDKFSYGNQLSTSGNAVDVSSSDDAFSGANNVDSVVAIYSKIGSARITERKNGTSFTFGARAFAGAEFFVLPKISIGAEFGWGLSFTSYGRTITSYESKGTTDSGIMVATAVIENKKGSEFKLDNSPLNNLWGSSAVIKLHFYF